MALAKKRFGVPPIARVLSCYEACRDGFWLHHFLLAQGIENRVVDSSSIEVNRRAKRAKTDRLDVGTRSVVIMLAGYGGEKKVWSVVHVPSVKAEDARHLHRELMTLKCNRTRHINRLQGRLAGQGVCLKVGTDLMSQLDPVRLWDGTGWLPGVRARVEREFAGWQFVHQNVLELEAS